MNAINTCSVNTTHHSIMKNQNTVTHMYCCTIWSQQQWQLSSFTDACHVTSVWYLHENTTQDSNSTCCVFVSLYECCCCCCLWRSLSVFVLCACVYLYCCVCVVGSVSGSVSHQPGPAREHFIRAARPDAIIGSQSMWRSARERSDQIGLFTEDRFEYFSVCLVTQLNEALLCSEARTRENGAESRCILGNFEGL